MDAPTIGRIVIYRWPEGFDSPAVVTATSETLEQMRALQPPIDERVVRSLSGPENVHLTVFAPTTAAQSLGSSLPQTDVPAAPDPTSPGPRSWRWPVRSGPAPVVHVQGVGAGDLTPIVDDVIRELNRRMATAVQR